VFELLERGEVLVVPTDNPLDEKDAWLAFRDVILGLEYCKPSKYFFIPSKNIRAPCFLCLINSVRHSERFFWFL